MITPHDTAVVGAFFMEGMRDIGDYSDLLERWSQGCYELVYEVTRYAEYCWELAEAGGAATGDFPGVYDYEVLSPFGTWFAERVMAEGVSPPSWKCCRELRLLAFRFFSQSGGVDLCALGKALTDVEFKG